MSSDPTARPAVEVGQLPSLRELAERAAGGRYPLTAAQAVLTRAGVSALLTQLGEWQRYAYAVEARAQSSEDQEAALEIRAEAMDAQLQDAERVIEAYEETRQVNAQGASPAGSHARLREAHADYRQNHPREDRREEGTDG